jgi:hypothetical protein
MWQLHVNTTREFKSDLRSFMKQRGIKRKSDAIHIALREAVGCTSRADYNYKTW